MSTTTKQRHTPGPWTYSPIHNGFRIDSARFGFICSVQAESDARLIAAAPELVEALETALNYFNYAEEIDAYEFADEIRGLIARIEGRRR